MTMTNTSDYGYFYDTELNMFIDEMNVLKNDDFEYYDDNYAEIEIFDKKKFENGLFLLTIFKCIPFIWKE
jgi:hypothetical protein